MDEDHVARVLTSLQGEALSTALLLPGLLIELIRVGVLAPEQGIHIVDSALLLAEKVQNDPRGPGPAAVEHARIRLAGLLARCRDMRPKDSS